MSLELHAPLLADSPSAGEPFVVSLPLVVHAPLIFEPNLQFVLEEAASGAVAWIGQMGDEVRIPWLPRGTWFVRWMTPSLALAAGRYRARAIAVGAHAERAESAIEFELGGGVECGALSGAWQVESAGDGAALDQLSWRRGAGDAFSRRFDHAAEKLSGELLLDAPQLRGRIVELGCGDGVLALGLALRCQPLALVAVDREPGWEGLDAELVRQHIPVDAVPECLSFHRADLGPLPFADGSFDLVLCWDGLAALDQGGEDTLREACRLLAEGGVLCLRCEAATVPVTALERSLRALGFEPWRVRMRCHSQIEYSAETRDRPIPDLAIGEVLTSWRKRGTY